MANETNVTCEFCKRTFARFNALQRHKKTVESCIKIQKELGHVVKKIDYICIHESCKRSLASHSSLQYHVLHCKSNKQYVSDEMKNKLNEQNKMLEMLEMLVLEVEELKKDKIKSTLVKKKPKAKRTTLPSKRKTEVWESYVGRAIGIVMCFCCGIKEVSSREFIVGHVTSIDQGGSNNVSNLRPICSSCNNSMGTQDMVSYMKKYYPDRILQDKPPKQ